MTQTQYGNFNLPSKYQYGLIINLRSGLSLLFIQERDQNLSNLEPSQSGLELQGFT